MELEAIAVSVYAFAVTRDVSVYAFAVTRDESVYAFAVVRECLGCSER